MNVRTGSDRIDYQDLQPHIRRKLQSKGGTAALAVSDNGSSNSTALLLPAGEDIKKGQAITSIDGIAFVADNANNKPAIGIAIQDILSGEVCPYITHGQAAIPNATFTIDGSVWLFNGDVNLTTTVPDYIIDNICQKIGTALSETILLASIEEPAWFD